MTAQRHIIVCGTGMAGLAAGVTALQAGARVTLVEKGSAPGGTTALSDGVIWTIGTFDEMVQIAPKADPILQRIVLDNIAADREWLAGLGVQLGPLRPVQAIGRGQNCDPRSTVQALLDQAASLGGRVLLETALQDLVVEKGRIAGIRAVTEGGEAVMDCDGVVLATGGFQGDPELMTRYVVSDPSDLLLRSNPWSTGDALRAATAVGAALTPGLNTFYGHALIAPPGRFQSTSFKEATQYYGPLSVVLNLRGERFTDESGGLATKEAELNQHVARQPEGKAFYVVDSKIAEMEVMPNSGLVTKAVIERARTRGAPIAVADTLEDLCRSLGTLGIDGARALETLREYNHRILSGEPELLRPPRCADRFPLTTPPYYAVGVQASITFTMGGLAVDADMCVLRQAAGSSPLARSISSAREFRAVPITGLWAAGSDVGNISHFGYMGGLGPALVTGRIAGANAAKDV